MRMLLTFFLFLEYCQFMFPAAPCFMNCTRKDIIALEAREKEALYHKDWKEVNNYSVNEIK